MVAGLLESFEEVVAAPSADHALPLGLARAADELAHSRSTSRYVALYPAAMCTVAINDGSRVSTAVDPSLHRLLASLLEPGRSWLLCDTRLSAARVVSVEAAQERLSRQLEPAYEKI